MSSFSLPPEDLSRDPRLAHARFEEYGGVQRPTIGRMILLAQLGQGGMGVVYFGVHPRLQVEVAVKLLSIQGARGGRPEHVERFLREARLAAQLRSDHLVSVLDVDCDQETGHHFIVMEFVPGSSAADWLDERRERGEQVSEREALELCIAATRGLAAAHEAGIVHRDVKPENVLIPTNARGEFLLDRAKLADLGLARSEAPGHTVTAVPGTMGSPGFMAPEQVEGAQPATRASDVFGMGATLHAVLAGRSPFRGKTPMQTMVRTIEGKREPLGALRPDVSEGTRALIRRCLSTEQQGRYPDAGALLAALEACRADVVSCPQARVAPAPEPEPITAETVATVIEDGPSPASEDPTTSRIVAAARPAAAPRTPPRESRASTAPTIATSGDGRSKRGPVWIAAGVGLGVVVALGLWAALSDPDEPTSEPTATATSGTSTVSGTEDTEALAAARDEAAEAAARIAEQERRDREREERVRAEQAEAERRAREQAERDRQEQERAKREQADRERQALERARSRLADAVAVVDGGRPLDALPELLDLRDHPLVGDSARPELRRAVRELQSDARELAEAGSPGEAIVLVEALLRLAGTGDTERLTPADGVDRVLLSRRLEAWRSAQTDAESARAALESGRRHLDADEPEAAAAALEQALDHPSTRTDAADLLPRAIDGLVRGALILDVRGERVEAIQWLTEARRLSERLARPTTPIDLELAAAQIAAGAYGDAERTLGRATGEGRLAHARALLRAKLALARNGGDEWTEEGRELLLAIPRDARERLAETTLQRAEAALETGELDLATLEARVALFVLYRSVRAKFVLGAAAAERILGGRRRGADLDTARNQLTTVVNSTADTDSERLRKLRSRAQDLLTRLPER